jgi:hypothetical protein
LAALLDRHIQWMDQDLDHQYCSACTPLLQRKYALVGFGLLTFWLAWLRSMEAFGLHWHDLLTIEPTNGALKDLPTYTLGPETKSTQTQSVDVPVAYQTLSGYQSGRWFHRAWRACGLGPYYGSTPGLIFTDADGTK